MIRSTNRFLTTHTGSLPRPDDLIRARTQPHTQNLVRITAAEIVEVPVHLGATSATRQIRSHDARWAGMLPGVLRRPETKVTLRRPAR